MNLDKAKNISEKYEQLKYCCGIISDINSEEKRVSIWMDELLGWRVTQQEVEKAGIDFNAVYRFIEKLARNRKAELEKELEQ
jgi:hypothetical protein